MECKENRLSTDKRRHFCEHEDLIILRSVLKINPYEHTRKWDDVVEEVNSILEKPRPFDKRSIKDRVKRLTTNIKRKKYIINGKEQYREIDYVIAEIVNQKLMLDDSKKTINNDESEDSLALEYIDEISVIKSELEPRETEIQDEEEQTRSENIHINQEPPIIEFEHVQIDSTQKTSRRQEPQRQNRLIRRPYRFFRSNNFSRPTLLRQRRKDEESLQMVLERNEFEKYIKQKEIEMKEIELNILKEKLELEKKEREKKLELEIMERTQRLEMEMKEREHRMEMERKAAQEKEFYHKMMSYILDKNKINT